MYNNHNTLNILKKIFAEILLTAEEDINIDQPYTNMGVDSILTIQIAKLINSALNINILPAELYNFISIKELSKYIDQLINNNKLDNNKLAIIGIAGRFPGAQNITEYWNNLKAGKNSIIKTTRWRESLNDNCYGGFLDNIEYFDADFFNISPKEAVNMDPQQRIMLETAFHAFEDAGITMEQLNATNTGIFTVCLPGDYRYLMLNENKYYNSFSFLGNAISVLPGRISYFFNCKGPAIALDTACSSSLVAINVAANYIKQKCCDFALVGASSIFCTPEIFNLAKEANLLSVTGGCYTFDQKADGFVPSEAVCCLVLTTVQRAIKDRYQIYATIEASEVNHDGFTNGLMSPNSNSQQNLFNSTYNNNNININDIAYIESHGTGTIVGDYLETKAFKETFEAVNPNYYANIGSVKANIGHTLVAAGIASIIKVIYQFKNSLIVPQINFSNINNQIELGNLAINTELSSWPQNKSLAVINGLGFNGTNAHLVLKKPSFIDNKQLNNKTYAFIFSAKTLVSLRKLLESYIIFLVDLEEYQLGNLSFSLICKTTILPIKIIILAKNKTMLIRKIKSLLAKNKFINKNNRINNIIKSADILYKDQNYDKIAIPQYEFDRKYFWIKKRDNNINVERTNIEQNTIKSLLINKLSELLEYNPQDITEEKPFVEYGIDSIVALQLLQPFKKILNIDNNLNSNIIFEQKNIKNLTEYLVNLSANKIVNNIMPLPKDFNNMNIIKNNYEHNNYVIEWLAFGRENDKPLILLPPLNTLANIWVQQLRYFSKKSYYILIPHYPGHIANNNYNNISLEAVSIAIAKTLLNIVNSNNFDIVGWSLGGCIGLIMNYLNLIPIKNLVLVNTAPKFTQDVFAKSSELREELLAYESYLNILYENKEENIINYISANCSMDMLKYYYQELQNFDFVNKLEKISANCSLFFGLQDSVIAKEEIDVFSNIKNIKLIPCETAGHFIPLTAPLFFNTKIEELNLLC